MLPALRAVCTEFDARFRVVGAGIKAERDRFPEMELVPWTEATEVAEVQGFDVGIMPLIDAPFERGKSAYKLVQYMACAVPSVASPVGANETVLGPGCGLFAIGDADLEERPDRPARKFRPSAEPWPARSRTRRRGLLAPGACPAPHRALPRPCGSAFIDASPARVIADRIRRTRSFLGREGLGPFLVKSLAGSGAVRLAAMAGSFAVGVQLARLLGVEGYGYYGLALSIITIVGIPGELGISRVVTREVAAAATTNDEPRLFGALRWARSTVLRLSLVMAALAVGGAFLAGAINPSVPTLAILFGAPVIPLMALARLDGGALQGLRHVVRGQIPANLLKPVFLSAGLLAVSVAGLRIGVAGAMALNSITAALVAVVAYAWLQQRLPKPQSGEVIRTGRQWLASSVPMALTDGMRTLQSELTILLIGIIAAPAAVGLVPGGKRDRHGRGGRGPGRGSRRPASHRQAARRA